MFDFVCLGTECTPVIRIAQVVICAFLGILFVQSGLDKVFDWEGNIAWLSDQFSETPFRGVVRPMVAALTVFEVASGFVSAGGAAWLLFTGNPAVGIVGLALCSVTFLMLFFGLRISKEYPGAAQLAPYFLISVFGLYLFQLG